MQWKYRRAPAETRFWARVEKTDGCWNWTGYLFRGYGSFYPTARARTLAHRFVYELVRGPIPKGLVIDHLCRNRACVRPDHLEVVTGAVNTLRGETISARFKAQTHCKYGHAFDAANTRRDQKGGRVCRACHLRRTHEFRARRASHPSQPTGEG